MSLCRSFFCGRVVRDIEVKQSKDGKSYAEFTLAVDTGHKESRYSNYFSLVAYNNNAENLAKYVPKGTKIIVECTPRQHRWQDKEGKNQSREIHMVNTWEFAESKQTQQQSQQQQQSQPQQQPQRQQRTGYKPWADVPPIYDDFV